MSQNPVFCLLSLGIEDSFFRKDIGVIPYIMQKHFGYQALYVTFCKPGATPSFPSLALFSEPVGLDCIPVGPEDDQEACLLRYVAQNAPRIGVLFLVGFYAIYFKAAELYKRLHPDGLIYCKLDANRFWVNNCQVSPNFSDFLKSCDVMTCETMAEYLNRKWPVPVHYIPNGFYNFDPSEDHLATTYSYKEKKNILLTVGRLGSPEKATYSLIQAFRLVANQIPDWKLCLVGGVEKSFLPYLERCRMEDPSLWDRLILPGSVLLPAELYRYYRNAKIFVLPSLSEGFANVLAEAKVHGCYLIGSDIECNREAASDFFSRGRLPEGSRPALPQKLPYGSLFPPGDTAGLARCILEACWDEETLARVCTDVQEDAREHFDWVRLCWRIHWLLQEASARHGTQHT